MPVIMDKTRSFTPGTDTWVGSLSQEGPYAVVFEDDGETGYFYAANGLDDDIDIYDALHIYTVDDRSEKSRSVESVVKIGWSPSGEQAVLMLNDLAHAVFDFAAKKGWCRDDYPPSNGDWSKDGHAWNDDALRFFR